MGTPLAGRPARASPSATTARRGEAEITGSWLREQATNASMNLPPLGAVALPISRPLPSGGSMCPRAAAAFARQQEQSTAQLSEPRLLRSMAPVAAETEARGGVSAMANLTDDQERRTGFQARLAELQGVIGASLQNLEEVGEVG